jgi:hypothetical protein
MNTQILPFLAGCFLITTIAATSPKVQEILTIKPVQPSIVVSQTFDRVSINTINNFILQKYREGYILKSNSLLVPNNTFPMQYSSIITLEKY